MFHMKNIHTAAVDYACNMQKLKFKPVSMACLSYAYIQQAACHVCVQNLHQSVCHICVQPLATSYSSSCLTCASTAVQLICMNLGVLCTCGHILCMLSYVGYECISSS
ncbi:unnamed protein product [Ectocarpus sp. 12 AP-2014]